MSQPDANRRPSRRDLWNARDAFRDLLDRNTTERQWQQFFAMYPFVFSLSLPLRLDPQDIVPLGRPGRSEPDFIFFPHAERFPSFYGVIELKRPRSKIMTAVRSNLAIPSRDAATAIEQARLYARSIPMLAAIGKDEGSLFLGHTGSAFLFVIMGMNAELAQTLAGELYREHLARQLPENLRLIPYDDLLERFEARVPPRILVLRPAIALVPAPAVTSFEFHYRASGLEYYHDSTAERGAPASGTIHVSWDGSAGEWVEWEEGEFLEGYEQGNVVYLPYSTGRASIGSVSAERLLAMYGLTPELVPVHRVRTTPPEKLARLPD